VEAVNAHKPIVPPAKSGSARRAKASHLHTLNGTLVMYTFTSEYPLVAT
jgi:hypothetical protein